MGIFDGARVALKRGKVKGMVEQALIAAGSSHAAYARRHVDRVWAEFHTTYEGGNPRLHHVTVAISVGTVLALGGSLTREESLTMLALLLNHSQSPGVARALTARDEDLISGSRRIWTSLAEAA